MTGKKKKKMRRYLELEEPVRSFECVDERLLHDGVRTVRLDEDGVVVVAGSLC